jgi:hypothetical protein
MGEPTIPAQAVESAARALAIHDGTAEDWDWPPVYGGALPEDYRESYRRSARSALAAAWPILVAPHTAPVGYVLGSCGHWWREHRPANVVIDPARPRVCAACRPGDPGVVGPSPQGLGLVAVTYLHDPSAGG